MPAEYSNKKVPAKDILKNIVEQGYMNARLAKERGEPIGWSTSKFPAEIAETLGLNVCYPENQAAAIAAKHGGQRMCEYAEGMGFSNDICAYARISIAYAAGNLCMEKPIPQPDFLLCSNNICNCVTKWYEVIAQIHNIPLIMIDVPYINDLEPDDNQVAYVRAQFDDAILRLEKISGRKWDNERFREVCQNANRASSSWLKACSYCQYTPSPLSGFDLFNHMAAVVTARCKPETAEAFDLLVEEYEQAVKTGTSTWRYEERHRIMFEGIPCWPVLKVLFAPLKEKGINTTAIVYAPAFGFSYSNMNEMIRAYCRAPNSVSIETGVQWREAICRENNVNGVLLHYNRSCKPWSGSLPEMQRQIRNDLGVAVVGFDGDQADPRNFSEAQYLTRVQGLHEIMEEKRKQQEGCNYELN